MIAYPASGRRLDKTPERFFTRTIACCCLRMSPSTVPVGIVLALKTLSRRDRLLRATTLMVWMLCAVPVCWHAIRCTCNFDLGKIVPLACLGICEGGQLLAASYGDITGQINRYSLWHSVNHDPASSAYGFCVFDFSAITPIPTGWWVVVISRPFIQCFPESSGSTLYFAFSQSTSKFSDLDRATALSTTCAVIFYAVASRIPFFYRAAAYWGRSLQHS